jgi:hypothetical protein
MMGISGPLSSISALSTWLPYRAARMCSVVCTLDSAFFECRPSLRRDDQVNICLNEGLSIHIHSAKFVTVIFRRGMDDHSIVVSRM